LFLFVLQNTLYLPGERGFRPPLAWAVPAFSAAMCLFFFRWGDYLLNVLWAVLMGTCGYCALRGLLFARRQNGGMRSRQYFDMAVLAFILLEYCLWVSSCYWSTDSFATPYVWFDFLLTTMFLAFIPALKKVVAA